jgi:hypothetical protein
MAPYFIAPESGLDMLAKSCISIGIHRSLYGSKIAIIGYVQIIFERNITMRTETIQSPFLIGELISV